MGGGGGGGTRNTLYGPRIYVIARKKKKTPLPFLHYLLLSSPSLCFFFVVLARKTVSIPFLCLFSHPPSYNLPPCPQILYLPERREIERVSTILLSENAQQEAEATQQNRIPDDDCDLLLSRVHDSGRLHAQGEGAEREDSIYEAQLISPKPTPLPAAVTRGGGNTYKQPR
jgi:hypothetical protein